MLRTMPDTMSDKGRHALGGNADATWTAFNFGLCTGGICIAFLTQLWSHATLDTTDATGRNTTDATQLRLTNAATETERFELLSGFQSSQPKLWMTDSRPEGAVSTWGAVWPDAWTFHARPLASDFGTRLSARSWGCATQTLQGTQQTQRTQQGRNAYEDQLAETQGRRTDWSNSTSKLSTSKLSTLSLRQNAYNATRPALEPRGRTQQRSQYATTPSHRPRTSPELRL
jgi:hypothetical protein